MTLTLWVASPLASLWSLPSLAPPASQEAAATSFAPGRYKAMLEVPGQTVVLALNFERAEDGSWSGTVDIPAQGVTGLPLKDVSLDSAAVSFGSATLQASFSVTPDPTGGWSGSMTQRGQTVPFRFDRLAQGDTIGPRRPQLPQPPYPYAVRELKVPNTEAGIVLAGTLTVPAGEGPHPALVLMTGSGPQDRDETLFAHKPFHVLADHLARAGIAVLRMDDRGIGDSEGDFAAATGMDFVSDAVAGFDVLRTEANIDPTRLGVGGHSEGGGLAPFVAVERDDVSFLLLLAGSMVPGRDLMPLQLQAVLRSNGVPEVNIAQQLVLQGRVLDLCIDAASAEDLREASAGLVLAQAGLSSMEFLPAAVRPQFEQAIDGLVAQFQTEWMRGFLTLDAREPLSTLDIPILALNGELDLQVLHEQNLGAVTSAAATAGNTQVITRALPGLNHIFQSTTTGRVDEYASIEETLSPEVLEIIASWLRATTGLD